MPEQEARARAVYDHTDEEPRPAGRRRRQVADWGVGEELFDGMPGRRFDRRGAEHAIPRGGADDGRRTIVITEDEVRFEDEAPSEEFASRDDALEARREHDAVWAGDEPFADTIEDPPNDAFADAAETFEAGGRFAEVAEAFEEGGRFAEPPPSERAEPDGIVRGGVEGRRTVKIGGRPGEFQSAPTRRRPARTMHERLGPRPDRIAAWAFALGLLLILIAVATANI
jgi:hypothetical protein